MASIFKSSYSIVNLPRDRGDTEQIEEMLQRPLYVLFRFMLNETSLISLVHAIHQACVVLSLIFVFEIVEQFENTH